MVSLDDEKHFLGENLADASYSTLPPIKTLLDPRLRKLLRQHP